MVSGEVLKYWHQEMLFCFGVNCPLEKLGWLVFSRCLHTLLLCFTHSAHVEGSFHDSKEAVRCCCSVLVARFGSFREEQGCGNTAGLPLYLCKIFVNWALINIKMTGRDAVSSVSFLLISMLYISFILENTSGFLFVPWDLWGRSGTMWGSSRSLHCCCFGSCRVSTWISVYWVGGLILFCDTKFKWEI